MWQNAMHWRETVGLSPLVEGIYLMLYSSRHRLGQDNVQV
jgi:hypothetical protein